MKIEKTDKVKYLKGKKYTNTGKIVFYDQVYDKRPIRTDLVDKDTIAYIGEYLVIKEVPVYRVTIEEGDKIETQIIRAELEGEFASDIRLLDVFYTIPVGKNAEFIVENKGEFLTNITPQEKAYITRCKNKVDKYKFNNIFVVDTVKARLENSYFRVVEKHNEYAIQFKNQDTLKAFILDALEDKLGKMLNELGIEAVFEKRWTNISLYSDLVKLERCKLKDIKDAEKATNL